MAIPVLRAGKAVYYKLSDEEENNMAQEDMIAPNAPGMEDEFGGYEEMKDGFKYNQEMGDDPRRPREETNEIMSDKIEFAETLYEQALEDFD